MDDRPRGFNPPYVNDQRTATPVAGSNRRAKAAVVREVRCLREKRNWESAVVGGRAHSNKKSRVRRRGFSM